MFVIKKLPKDRWPEFKALRLESLKQDPSAYGSSYEEEAEFADDVWKRRIGNALFALDEGKPIGMLSRILNERLKTKHYVEIVGAYVMPSYRGRGVGTKLLEEQLRLIRRKDSMKRIVKVKLMVNPEQKAAVRVYKKAGFQVVGRAKKELKVGSRFYDMLYMERFLQKRAHDWKLQQRDSTARS